MLKLYKRENSELRYHEAWAHKRTVYEHWGIVGEIGESKEHKVPKGTNEEEAVRYVLELAERSGYKAIESDDHVTLVIEYRVEGHGTGRDVDRLHALEARMNETLGWTGLGHCDGNSIGSGTMEVFCPVVDFGIARRVIEDDLKGTDFADYTRICTNEDL